MILVRDHHGNHRLSQDFIGNLENCFERTGACDLEIPVSVPAQMIRHSALCRIDRIGLCPDVVRRGAGMASPVIKELRNMHNILCLIRQPQNHVVILRAVKFRAVQFLSLQELPIEAGKVTDVVVRTQIVDGIIGLEMNGHKVIQIIFPEGRLVAVQVIRILLIDRLDVPVQNRRMKVVVMIKRCDVLALCQCKAGVRVLRNSSVFLKLPVTDSPGKLFAPTAVFLYDFPYIRMLCIRPVRKAQLPVSVGLIQHRIHHVLQIFLRGVVERNQDAEQNLSGKAGRLLCLTASLLCVRKACGSVALLRLLLTNLITDLFHNSLRIALIANPICLTLHKMIGVSRRL